MATGMTKQEKALARQAGLLRKQAAKLLVTANHSEKRATALYKKADAERTLPTPNRQTVRVWEHEAEILDTATVELHTRIDALHAAANCLWGYAVRRACLKCSRSFASTSDGNRLCARCDASNVGLVVAPTASPKMNRKAMNLEDRG